MPASAAELETAPSRTAVTIALAVLGVFVTYVPITAISVALTTIGKATSASTGDLQWVSDSYVIPMAAAVLSAGVLGDRFGRRRVYLVGMVLTVLGAAVAGFAGTVGGSDALPVLWSGQVVSGLGAGALLPTTLALISHAVPNPRERGKFIGFWATGLMLGLALGPMLSGSILAFTTWGWIFTPTAVLAAVAGLVALLRLPESRAPQGRRVDVAGQLTATLFIAASIFGTIQGGADGWTAASTVTALVVAAVSLVAFIVVEGRVSSPLLDLRLFRSATFTAASISALVALFAIVGTMFLLSLFLGYVQQLDPLQIGGRLLFVTGVGVVISPVVGMLMSRSNPLLLLAAGLATAALGTVAISGTNAETDLFGLAWRLAIFGVAVAVMMTAASTAAVNSVPWQQAGMAAAASTAMRQYGGALGPAVLGAVFTSQLSGGSSPADAFGHSLLTNAYLLGAAAVGCVLAAYMTRSSRSSTT